MKKLFILIAFVALSLQGFTQSLRTDDYELYLTYIEVNEVNIAKSLEMSAKKQYFYEGTIQVDKIADQTSNTYRFYFSVWDDKYKEFYARKMSYEILKPQFTFNDNDTPIIVKDGEIVKLKLKDNSSIDMAALSAMLAWLENK